MVLFFPRLNLCNLSLLPEDYNGIQLQGFQSLQDKAIYVILYFIDLLHYQQIGSETPYCLECEWKILVYFEQTYYLQKHTSRL